MNIVPDMEDNEYLPVPENEGTVPEDLWVNTWWNDKLRKVGAISSEVRNMFGQGDDVDDDDDIYS